MTAAVLRGGDAGRLLRVCSFGGDLVPYFDGLRLQQRLAQLCKERAIPDTLLLLQARARSASNGANQAMTLLSAAADPGCARPCGQHAPVYTLGKRGSSKDFRTAPEALQAAGAEVHRSDRGGEVTYHGPGQVVMYPVVNLRRLGVGARAYVEGLEDAMVRTAGVYGVCARGRVLGRTGVWVGDRKLGAVGVRISHGVATHGVALNVATDLRAFAPIVACGLADAVATSLQHELTAAARPGGGGPKAWTGESAGGGPDAARSPGCNSLAGRASDAQGARGARGAPGASADAGFGHVGDGVGEVAPAGRAVGPWRLGGVDAVELVAAQLAGAFASRFRYSRRERVTPAELHAVAAGAS